MQPQDPYSPSGQPPSTPQAPPNQPPGQTFQPEAPQPQPGIPQAPVQAMPPANVYTPQTFAPQPQPGGPPASPTTPMGPGPMPGPTPAAVQPDAAPGMPPAQPGSVNSYIDDQPANASAFQQPPAKSGLMGGLTAANPFGGSASKKKLLIIGGIILAALAVALGLTMAVMNMMASIKLTDYSGDKYSIQVPADYKKDVSGASINFSEDEPEKTRSEVMVYYADFPTALSGEQVSTIRDTLRTQLRSAADDLADDVNRKVEDLKVGETKFQDADALELTAKIKEDGNVVGNVKLVAVVNTKQMYMIGVAAHESDKGLQKQTDAIIDSFKLK